MEQAFADDDRAQARGEPPHYQALVGADPAVPGSYRGDTVTVADLALAAYTGTS